jgi:hypothetical protein
VIHAYFKICLSLGLALYFSFSGAIPFAEACPCPCCSGPHAVAQEGAAREKVVSGSGNCCCEAPTTTCGMWENPYSPAPYMATSGPSPTKQVFFLPPVAGGGDSKFPLRHFSVYSPFNCPVGTPLPLYLFNVSLLC